MFNSNTLTGTITTGTSVTTTINPFTVSNGTNNINIGYGTGIGIYTPKTTYVVLGEEIEVDGYKDTNMASIISLINVLGKQYYDEIKKQGVFLDSKIEKCLEINFRILERDRKIDSILNDETLDKLASFIDLLLEYKLDDLNFDVYTKRKTLNYSLGIDTKVPHNIPNLFNFDYGFTKNVYVYLCPKNNSIALTKDGYKDFIETNADFVNKYSKIIEKNYNRIQKEKLNSIIDTTLEELKLVRENNLNKLI